MNNTDILVIGGDLRQTYLVNALISMGYKVSSFLVPNINNLTLTDSDEFKKTVSHSKYIICPLPLSKDHINIYTCEPYSNTLLPIKELIKMLNSSHTFIAGAIDTSTKTLLSDNNINYCDINTYGAIKHSNALLTAEGLLKYIIEKTPFSINDSHILVTGFGECGMAISKILSSLGAHITVYNRSKKPLDNATKLGYKIINNLNEIPYSFYFCGNTHFDKLPYQIIINTVPYRIMDAAFLKQLDNNCHLFEIASNPGGFDTDAIKNLKLFYENVPGIPGKTAPMTASQNICRLLCENILRL